MVALTVICSILAVLCIIIGLILSRVGTSGGLTSIMGQDLEIFKKSKDRGVIKIFQIMMFVMAVILLFIILLAHIFIK